MECVPTNFKTPQQIANIPRNVAEFLSGIWQYRGDRGGTVVKVLCYKSEGRRFDLRWCHWNFSLT